MKLRETRHREREKLSESATAIIDAMAYSTELYRYTIDYTLDHSFVPISTESTNGPHYQYLPTQSRPSIDSNNTMSSVQKQLHSQAESYYGTIIYTFVNLLKPPLISASCR